MGVEIIHCVHGCGFACMYICVNVSAVVKIRLKGRKCILFAVVYSDTTSRAGLISSSASTTDQQQCITLLESAAVMVPLQFSLYAYFVSL